MYEAMAITDPQVVSLPFMETIRDRLLVVPKPVRTEKPKCFGLLYGSSPAMEVVYDLIERVAHTDATVLIVGESGSGKELVANTIHRMSARGKQPFVAVNCGAIPATLIEAELFGYEKGAFTGAAKTHRGYLERATGGTLFLDEITEMPPEMQVRLLRVLETGTFCRVGGDQEIQAEARIIAATNRDPATAVADNFLREDLMYRLAVFPITLPPLRTRGDDVRVAGSALPDGIECRRGNEQRVLESFAHDAANASLAGQRAGAQKLRATRFHPVRRRSRAAGDGAGKPGDRHRWRLPAIHHRHAARHDGKENHLRHAGPLRRQQAPGCRDPGGESQDALQPPRRICSS